MAFLLIVFGARHGLDCVCTLYPAISYKIKPSSEQHCSFFGRMKVLNRSLDNVAARKATERIQHPALDDNADNMECNIGFLTVLQPRNYRRLGVLFTGKSLHFL